MNKGWIGVDLDGTLAHYDGWVDETAIGEPVPAMVERIKRWITEGYEVRIFTARVSHPSALTNKRATEAIREWCMQHIGWYFEVTATKDFAMIELWDDRCVAVEANTGRPLNESSRGLS